MPAPRPLLLALVGATLLFAGMAATTRAATFELGVGDQQARMFSDPRFVKLKLHHVRVVAPYDVVCRPDVQQYYLDVWLAAAKRTGARPLVAFSFSLRDGQRWKLPTYRTFVNCFRAFRKRYPQVSDFNPWNEANHSAQPTFRHPKKAAGFYNGMRRVCPSCQIAAGDLLDWGNLTRWLERYRPWLIGRPRLWSMHNYIDVNRGVSWQRSNTRRLLRLTRGRLWITETAGVVYSRRYDDYDEERAAEATRRMFSFAARSPRITRLYGYQWQAGCDSDAWDSAWFRSDGSSRPAYRVFLRELAFKRGLSTAAVTALDPPIGPQTYDACADDGEAAGAIDRVS
jgi:hypothetical protein